MSTIPSTAAAIEASFIFMKSVRVLSRSKRMARIIGSLGDLPAPCAAPYFVEWLMDRP